VRLDRPFSMLPAVFVLFGAAVPATISLPGSMPA